LTEPIATSPTIRRPLWRRWLPVAVWLAVIFVASTSLFTPERTSALIDPVLRAIFPHADPSQIDRLHLFVRKTGHVVEYAILAILLARATLAVAGIRAWWFASSLLLLALVAASDEFHQYFVHGREASIRDVLLDIAGGAAALVPIAICRQLGELKPRDTLPPDENHQLH
jgi:VanZ family protein